MNACTTSPSKLLVKLDVEICSHVWYRMILQVEHLADTYFAHAESDLGERELDLAQQIDCDLDTFHATIGLTKAVIESALSEDGERLVALS